MKKTLLTLALVATTVAAFAQGKVTFGNNSARLFVLDDDTTRLKAGDIASAGQPIPNGALPSGVTLVAGLYAGTSSSSMTLQSSTTILTGTGWLSPGTMANRTTLLATPGWASPNPVTFQVAIWDSAFATPQLSGLSSYVGFSQIFTMVPGTSIAYPFLYQTTAPALSTWAVGNIEIGLVPEPSSFALAGLGMASLLIFRRRK
jgi:hypothetical protein